jgi:DNA-binding transcriptional MerR regulator
MSRSYTVGQVSRISGVTVRTLHHYDEIGLLHPSARTDAGYRSYSDGDLERLQSIRFYRELGFSLDEIGTILDDPSVDAFEHLERQRELLTRRIEHMQRMVTTVERTMEARRMGINLTPEEMFEVFGDTPLAGHDAEQEWGDTDAWRQSQQRTSAYTKEDWKRLMTADEELRRRFAAAMAEGTPAASPAVMDLAEEHRQSLNRWFFDCSFAMHRAIGDRYVADPRFAATFTTVPGMERYVRDAIHANADRNQG